jgi:hypothetical protein
MLPDPHDRPSGLAQRRVAPGVAVELVVICSFAYRKQRTRCDPEKARSRMRKRVLLLAVAVAMALTWPRRSSAQDFCPAMVGMSVCDESEWATYAQCWYDLAYQMCMDADPPYTAAYCASEADRIYWQTRDGELDTCQQIVAECRLQGGTFNWENYHCDLSPPCPPGGDGGGGSGSGGGACQDGQLVTVEECESLCDGIVDEEAGECIVREDSMAPGVGNPSANAVSPADHMRSHRADLMGSSLGRGTIRRLFSHEIRGLRTPLIARHPGGGQKPLSKAAPKQDGGERREE